MTEESVDLRTFQKMMEMNRIFQTAVAKAQEESRRLGVPNVYSINGILHYELPNGELTTVPPAPKRPPQQDPGNRESH
jgi:hypothetical protein